MSALVRMRLAAFLRSARILPPLITGLLVLGVLNGGGPAPLGEAYGVSAVVLFPVVAWQSKLLLDAEPDVQRRLARVAAGGRTELFAGVCAAVLVGFGTALLALVLPWLVGGVRGPEKPGEPSIALGVALGGWAHLLAVLAAVALGALASRAVTRSALYGVTVLFAGTVLAIVLGLTSSVAPWLTPPLMATARAMTGGVGAGSMLGLTAWAVSWSAVVLAGYGWLRRTRS